MRSSRNKILILSATALVLYIADQWSKYVIRTTPELQSRTLIDGWLSFNYTKNPGMALGITWAETWVISLVAIVATFAIIFYISRTLKEANTGYLVCMGLIIGGALGNITDRLFMARIMDYGSWLDGHVVDFIHFTLEVGGYRVFPYIFNVADMGISVSIIILLIFGKWILPHDKPKEKTAKDESSSEKSLEAESTVDVTGEGNNRPKAVTEPSDPAKTTYSAEITGPAKTSYPDETTGQAKTTADTKPMGETSSRNSVPASSRTAEATGNGDTNVPASDTSEKKQESGS